MYTPQLGIGSTTHTPQCRLDTKLWLHAQVVYPGDDVTVPVNVTGSRIAVPAAVTYQLDPQTPLAEPFLPSVNGSLGGVLRWDPAKGGRINIAVPVEWSQVGAYSCSWVDSLLVLPTACVSSNRYLTVLLCTGSTISCIKLDADR